MNSTPLRIAINGLGRIGRMFIRLAWDNPALEIVAVNSPSDAGTYAHLIKYDSLYGIWDKTVEYVDGHIVIDGKKIPSFQVSDKERLPWADIQPDIVLEASGKYRKREDAAMHLQCGAKRVMVTAPMENPDVTMIAGINPEAFDPATCKIISAASCSTTAAAMVLKGLQGKVLVDRGFMTIVHAVTGDQNLNDGAHKDLRRARAATESIIPSTTGLTATIDKLFPELTGKISGISMRVPVTVPSIISMTLAVSESTTAEAVNTVLTEASNTNLRGHLAVSTIPLVSIDYKQNHHGAVVDTLCTTVVDEKLLNIEAWYDNEWGYTAQVALLLEQLADKLK